MDNTQNIISFCTGYGGIELGLRGAGMDTRTVCYVEIEAFAQANLVAKIEEGRMDSAPIWSNLKTFPASGFHGKVQGIIGGYPCQPFSSAGNRKGTDDPRHLWPFILQHIRTIRPVWCFFENVEGHISLGLREVIEDLEGEGYKVEAGIFSAEEVGAPHRRKRVFILARLVGHSTSPRPHRGSENCEGEQSGVLGERLESNAELANSEGARVNRVDGNNKKEGRSSKPNSNGEELAHANNCGGGKNKQSTELRAEGTQQPSGNSRWDSQTKAGEVSEELAHSSSGRSREGRDSRTTPKETKKTQLYSTNAPKDNCKVWPSRPGEAQWDGEEKRTIEPGMGRTANGVTSRVDELRLLGNGVVPQTAELAFKTLWRKLQ